MDDSKDAVAPKSRRFEALSSYFSLLVYSSPTWVDHVLLIVGTISAAAAGTPFPLMGILFGQLVDDLNSASCKTADTADPSEIQRRINEKVLVLVYIGIASFVLIYIYIVAWSVFSRRLEARLRDRYFSSMLRQDAAFYDKRTAGELSNRLNADIQAIQSGTSEKVGICIACTSFFLTGYIVAFIKDAKLAGMLVSLIPAFIGMAAAGSYFTQKFSTRMSDSIASASSIAQETLSHIAVVQAFGAGKRLESKFEGMMSVAKKEGVKKAITTAVQAGMLYFIAYAANALAFWEGSHQIADSLSGNGDLSVGKVYTVIFLLVDSCVVLGQIAPLLPLLSSAAASFRKVRADIESPSPIDSSSKDGIHLPVTTPASLTLRNVSFAYVARPDHPVLNDVSLDCPAGKYTALVGLSGSGKSTIAGLATRLYDPTAGEVLFSDHDLKTLNVNNLRSFMSLVQQEPSLLDRSILENIALGLLNSPWEHHQKFQGLLLSSCLADIAARVRGGETLDDVSTDPAVAELVELIRKATALADATFADGLEHGYGTQVGVGGKLVSGGQRQRIALARALIRDPKVLILDEATASLDSASEKRIQVAVENIAKERTVIAIAHRLSTIKNADNIIVLNAGQVIEQGSHSQLMELDGSYAAMVRLQTVHSDRPESVQSSLTDNDSFAGEKARASDSEVTVLPEAVAERKASGTTVVRRLFGMIRPKLIWLLVAIVSGTIVGATFSSNGVIFGHTIAALSPCNSTSSIRHAGSFFGGMFFLLACVELLANTASWSSFGYLAETLLYKIRILTFRSLYSQPLDWHQAAGRTPSSLLSIITADTAAVGGFSGSIIGTIFSIVVNFLIAIVLSHIIAWKIAIVCLVTVPILLGSGIMQGRSLAQFERKHATAFSNAISITVEAVNSFKTVSSLSLEPEILETYRRSLHAPQRETAFFSAYTNFWLAIANSIGNLIYAFAYWWGSTRIAAGEYNQTQFFIILIAMLVSAQLWGQMFALAPEVSRAKAAASRILNIIDLPSGSEQQDVESSGEVASQRAMSGATIVFKDVTFAYPARPTLPILQNMSFTIQSGQFIGLVGPSGAGKSTIMSLVQRMYRPTSGVVEINGLNIGARGTEFRHDIAVVPQDCALFNGTVRFNVALGARPDETVTDEEIEEACRIANIHDTIADLPDGYDTECGPNGSRLSGGQRQRLAIARALVRKPKLLLLDESTSALDAESERALQEGLERASQNITVIAITHRLHTVRKADIIFVVEGGKVVDKGRHEELVERSESYRVNALQQML